MRISICGPERQQAISKVEKQFNVEAKKPWEVNGNSTIIDYAAETYKYNGEQFVLFDGSPFDFLGKNDGEGYDEIKEQIAIDTLSNLNYIIVITTGMDKQLLKSYEDYAKLFPEKFYLYTADTEFEIKQ